MASTGKPASRAARTGRLARMAAGAFVLSALSSPTTVRADSTAIVAAIAAGDCKAAGAAVNAGLERNDPDAFFYAGYLYDGTGCVGDDPVRAARLYRRAADLGSVDAATAIGLLYGLGRGVERDYAEAWRWYRVASARSGPAPAVSDERAARVAGYAITVVRVAVSKVRYPRQMERDGIGGSLDAVFEPATGVVTFRNVRSGTALGSNVARSHLLVEAVGDAYAAAVAAVPRADGATATDTVSTPWRFALLRNDADRPTTEGGITVGDTIIGAP